MSRETRFRKKPMEVDAMPVREIIHLSVEHGPGGMPEWLVQAMAVDPETDEGYGGVARLRTTSPGDGIEVRTKQGRWVGAELDEWIACAAPDDLWPIPPDAFEATYEAVTPNE